MSNIKRFVLGLLVIGLGVGLALPFRRPQPPKELLTTTDGGRLTLGEDVALQVPGQAVAPTFQPLPLSPDVEEPAESEPANAYVGQSQLKQFAPPPSLPDRYLPLFEADRPADVVAKQVIRPSVNHTPKPRTLRRHTIHDGDTLESLAVRYLGDPDAVQSIVAANPVILSDPNLLPIGRQIIIPDKRNGLSNMSHSSPSGPPATSQSVEQLVPLPVGRFQAH